MVGVREGELNVAGNEEEAKKKSTKYYYKVRGRTYRRCVGIFLFIFYFAEPCEQFAVVRAEMKRKCRTKQQEAAVASRGEAVCYFTQQRSFIIIIVLINRARVN